MADPAQIKEHMNVISSDGRTVGTVDRVEGGSSITLTRQSTGHGHHHIIPVSWVDHVDTHVHLNQTSDYVARNWQHGH